MTMIMTESQGTAALCGAKPNHHRHAANSEGGDSLGHRFRRLRTLKGSNYGLFDQEDGTSMTTAPSQQL